MMKRTRGIIAMFLLLALLLTACGQSSQTPTVVDEPENTTPVVVEPVQQEDTATEPLVFSDQPANVFRAKFEGSNVAGKGEVVDGVYRFTATKTDGEAWHVKLESNYMTVPGRDYRVTYHFNSDVAGTVKFGDFNEFAIRKGENTVTGQVSASNGYTYLDLQLGALKPFTIDFTSIEVEELETEADYESVMTVPIAWSSEGAVYVQHDPGYFYKLDRHLDGVTMKVEEIPFSAEVWMSRLYVKTAAILEPGALYRVSADVSATHEMDMEVCFNNGDNEKAYGAFYGQRMGDMSKRTFQQLIDLRSPGSEGGEVVLQFAFGKSPDGSQVTVDNIRVEKVHEHYTNMLPAYFAMNGSVEAGTEYETAPCGYETMEMKGFSYNGVDNVYEWHASEYTTALHESEDSATLDIVTAPDQDRDVWKVKLFVDTGVTLQADKAYRISADVSATGEFGYELCYNNGGTEKGVGALYGLTASTDARTIVYEVTGKDAGLVLQFAVGNAASGTSVTVKNVKVEEIGVLGGNLMTRELTNVAPVDFWAHEDYSAALTADGEKATLAVTSPAEGREVWKTKLFVHTGVQLTAGKLYRVSADVTADNEFSYEICYNKDGEEKGFDARYGLTAKADGETVVQTMTAGGDGELKLQLSVGNAPSGTKVTVNNVKVEEVAALSDNLMTRELTNVAPVDFWAHEDYSAGLAADGEKATLAVTSPAEGREVWKTKLFVHTGIQLTAGKLYRVSADVAADNGFSYEICYNKNGEEKGFDARYGLTAKTAGETVVQTMTAGGDGELVLQFAVGNASSGTNVTVQNVKVQAFGTPGDDLAADLKYDSIGFFNVNADGGYVTKLTQAADSVTFAITEAPADRNPWNVKLNARTGFFPKSGKSYRVKFDIVAEKSQDKFEVFYDGSTEKVFGELYEQRLSAGEKRTVSHTIQGVSGQGELSIQIRLGATNGTDGNSYTISNIRVEQVNYMTTLVPVIRSVTELWTHEDYAAKLSTTANAATVRMTTVPTEGREAWKTKLFVETGATLKAGQKYRITFTTSGSEGMPYEVCLNHGGEEKGLGGIFGLSAMADGDTITYVTTPEKDIDLVLQFSLGNAWTGGSFTVRNIKVEKAGASSTVSNVTYTF